MMTHLVDMLPELWMWTGVLALVGVALHLTMGWSSRGLWRVALRHKDAWIRAAAWDRVSTDPVRIVIKVFLAWFAFNQSRIMHDRDWAVGWLRGPEDVEQWAIFTGFVVVLSIWSLVVCLARVRA
jgi:hypothetical protein